MRTVRICHTDMIRNCVVYTGTHDNETLQGWFRNLSQHDRNFARAYIGCEGKHETAAVWSMIRAAMSSVADRCVIPVQDYLCLGNGNEPSINRHPKSGNGGSWKKMSIAERAHLPENLDDAPEEKTKNNTGLRESSCLPGYDTYKHKKRNIIRQKISYVCSVFN